VALEYGVASGKFGLHGRPQKTGERSLRCGCGLGILEMTHFSACLSQGETQRSKLKRTRFEPKDEADSGAECGRSLTAGCC